MEQDTSKSKKRKLEDSEESHVEQFSITCTYPNCGEKFQFQAQLNRHIKKTGHDLSNLKLKCPVFQCSRAFGGSSSNQDLISHMKNDHSKEERGKLECKRCFKIFGSIPPLKVHVTSKTCQAKKAPNSSSSSGSTPKIVRNKKSNVVKQKISCKEDSNKVVKKKIRSMILSKSVESPDLPDTSSEKNSPKKSIKAKVSKPRQSVPQAPQPKINPKTTNVPTALKTVLPPGTNSMSLSTVEASPASASFLLGMYRCTKCTRLWETLSALQNHFSTEHRNEPKTALEDLGKQLILVKVLSLKEAELKKVFKCSKCVESFPQNQFLITHMRCHPPNGYGGFPCTKCTGAFTTKQQLKDHLIQGHIQNILPNQQKQNGGLTNFNGKESNEDPWSGIEITPDNSNETNTEFDSQFEENAEINLTCDNPECFGKSFATKDELEYHRLTHIIKNEPSFDEDENFTTEIDFKSQEMVKCHICFLEFRGPGLLLSHIALYHHCNLQPNFQCTACDKKFLATDELRYHQIEHTSYWNYLDGEQRQQLEKIMFSISKSKQVFKCVHENCKKLAPYLIFQEFLKHVESSHSIIDEIEEEEEEEVNIKYEFEPEEAEIYGDYNIEY